MGRQVQEKLILSLAIKIKTKKALYTTLLMI
jgi:hypothetical protein